MGPLIWSIGGFWSGTLRETAGMFGAVSRVPCRAVCMVNSLRTHSKGLLPCSTLPDAGAVEFC